MHLMSAQSGAGVIVLVIVGLLVVEALQRRLGAGRPEAGTPRGR